MAIEIARRCRAQPPPPGGWSTMLCWTIEVDEPRPDDSLIGHLRKRMNVLINADLRYSFGQ